MFKKGYILKSFNLPGFIQQLVKESNFLAIDKYFKEQCSQGGELYSFLKQYKEFEQIEFIISLRDSSNEWEEDGIWHDDGSRKLAFSLSILDSCNTIGGVLEIRKKGTKDSLKISPFNFGQIVVFNTGVDNFEHKINAVQKGKRLVIAGWCS